MRRFYVLVTICLIFIVTVSRIHFAEDIKNSTPDDAKEGFETTYNEAVPEENNKEEEMTQEEWEEKERIAACKLLFETKCNKCHTFQRVLLTKKTLKEWKETVEKMHKKDLAWILPVEVTTIIDYLFKIDGIEKKEIEQDTTLKLEKLK